jgi:hypothetical protein
VGAALARTWRDLLAPPPVYQSPQNRSDKWALFARWSGSLEKTAVGPLNQFPVYHALYASLQTKE